MCHIGYECATLVTIVPHWLRLCHTGYDNATLGYFMCHIGLPVWHIGLLLCHTELPMCHRKWRKCHTGHQCATKKISTTWHLRCYIVFVIFIISFFRLEMRRKKPTVQFFFMVDILVIRIRQSHIITHNIQKYISQTYNNSNFDRLKNYNNVLSMLKGISAWKFLRIFSLNHKIIANLAFSDPKNTLFACK